MKKNKTSWFARLSAFLMAAILLMGGCVSVYAAAYQTYTYSINGFAVSSPDAYTPERTLHSVDLGLENELNAPKDIVVDTNKNVYIADSGNNRILVFTEYFNYRFEISSFINGEGISDGFSNPSGVFVTDDSIYVADTDHKRIVVFDIEGNFDRILEEPRSDVFPDNSQYRPNALAVDDAGRIYVVSSTTYMGVIVLDSQGEFQNFIGAQTVSYNLLDLFWRQFQSEEQKETNSTILPTEYNNITIDADGFVYVTSSSISEENQQASIQNNDKTYSPVKRLNAQGTDIMVRNGFFGPGGEVAVAEAAGETSIGGASQIVDCACGPEGTWSVIDQKRSKVYTYDDQGNLLFVFGDKGQMLGNVQTLNGITYQGDRILLLDRQDKSITVYNRTEYGDILLNALHNNNARNYEAAVDDWNAILQRNGNFDVAYVGLGKAFYNDGNWDKAMDYFKSAYDTEHYDQAFRQMRNEWVSKYVLIIPVVVIAFVVALAKFFGWANKVNKKTSLDRKVKKTFKQEVCYAYYVMFHPFDGFWDLKHEKRGSVRASLFFIVWAVIAFTYQQIGQAYLFSGAVGATTSVFMQTISVIVPLLLWVTANWCLTTLFEGEGSFKDIFIATGYALAPMPWFVIPATICTHFASLNEAGLITLATSIAWVWVGMLIFFGVMITHDYPLFKNLITCVGTIVGMAFIMFIAILFSTLMMKIVGFISGIVYEISYSL